MTNRAALRSLTLVALMNALILALIATQLVAPFVFVPLLCVVPTVFAIEALYVPLRVTLLSCCVVIGLAFLAFGLPIGCWTVVYVLVGAAAGLTRRWKWHGALRALATAVALTVLITGVLALFSVLTGLTLPHLIDQLNAKLPHRSISVTAIMGAALLVFVVTFAIMIDRLVTTIVNRLPVRAV